MPKIENILHAHAHARVQSGYHSYSTCVVDEAGNVLITDNAATIATFSEGKKVFYVKGAQPKTAPAKADKTDKE